MMLNIRVVFFSSLISISLFAHMDDLIYLSKTSSNEYFSDINDSEIDAFCKTDHGGIDEINFCEKRKFEKNNNSMTEVYKKVIKHYKNNPERKRILKKIIKSQNLWVAFREADCSSVYTVIGFGSMRGQQYFWCKSKLTQEREAELFNFYLDEYK